MFSTTAIVRMEGLDRLQLEAADLQHDPGVICGSLHKRNRRGPDVATDQYLASARSDDVARQCRRRGLAVRPGNGDDMAFQKSRREFHLADHRNAALACVYKLRDIEGHARTDDDEILITECAFAVLAGFHADAMVEQ